MCMCVYVCGCVWRCEWVCVEMCVGAGVDMCVGVCVDVCGCVCVWMGVDVWMCVATTTIFHPQLSYCQHIFLGQKLVNPCRN